MSKETQLEESIIFLHHSTGKRIWRGNTSKFSMKLFGQGAVQKHIANYNKHHATSISIEELEYPSREGYGWKNYPFDYYNIWVKNGDKHSYMKEPTLNDLALKYKLIIWKHCFPVSWINASSHPGELNSEEKTLANYKLQYVALKNKMHEFPENDFLVWTGPALVKSMTTEEQAKIYAEFYNWLINEWDESGDNIFLWDFYKLQTENSLYFQDKYAVSSTDSHPNEEFSEIAAKLLTQRIISIMNGRGDLHSLTGN